MDNTKAIKATSYKDLIQTFQQAVTQTHRQKKTPRTLHLKKPPQNQNKQNIQTKHQKSTYEKTSFHNSQWQQQDVLKQLTHKRKDKQYMFSYNKFITYITNLMANLTGFIPPELLHKKLTYLQYLAALKEIRFIKETYQPSPNDLVCQLWNQLNSHQQNVGLFIVYISGILNMKKNQDDGNSQRNQHLWKKYSDLRYTRMQLLGKIKTSQTQQQQYSFSPIISQRSRTLAASRSKSKTLRQKDKQSYKNNNNNSQFQQSQHQHYELNKQSINRQSIKQFQQDYSAGNKRSQILYKLAKQKSLQKRRDKKSNDVQYQKSIKELTFKPKIHVNKEHNNKKYIQGQQDSIDRMIRGRVQREVKKIINQKGLPYNQKMFQKMKKQKYQAIKKNNKNGSVYLDFQEFQEKKQKNQPNEQINHHQSKQIQPKGKFPLILSVQVDEGIIKKLIINEGQNYKQVADKFIKQLKLSQQMYQKLIIGVQNALKSQLTQIDQDSFESEYQSIC